MDGIIYLPGSDIIPYGTLSCARPILAGAGIQPRWSWCVSWQWTAFYTCLDQTSYFIPYQTLPCCSSHTCWCRNPAKMELVRELAMDGILYMPGPDVVTATTDLSKGASLNRVLRKIYPRGTQPKPTDLVAIFDDDQVSKRKAALLFFMNVAFLKSHGLHMYMWSGFCKFLFGKPFLSKLLELFLVQFMCMYHICQQLWSTVCHQ